MHQQGIINTVSLNSFCEHLVVCYVVTVDIETLLDQILYKKVFIHFYLFLAFFCSTCPVRHVETMWTGISSRRPWPWPITTRPGAPGCIFHVEQIISFRTSQRCRWLCPTPKSMRNLHYRRQLITWWMSWGSFLAKPWLVILCLRQVIALSYYKCSKKIIRLLLLA